jgi:RNA polymerase sigma factor (sigma-70 family)
MATCRLSAVCRHLKAALLPHDGGPTDGQLLERFLGRKEEAAFEALVRRHGPMVLGVCRRVLPNAHDAEDAFQAAFLVLVRKASTIRRLESVGSWLYGVAYRTALDAAKMAARRRSRERQVSPMPEPVVVDEAGAGHDVRPVLDGELSRLPDKYREAVVLCDLEGKTRKEAARQLGVPEGTLSGRLTNGRRRLAKRLARHGLALSGGALAAALTHGAASACVPAPLLGATVQAAARVAAGGAVAGVVSARVAALTEGVLKTMFLSRIKLALAVALVVGLIGSGWGVISTRAAPADPPKKEADKPAPADGEAIALPTDPGPVQVLASLDKDAKLVIKTAEPRRRMGGGQDWGPAPPQHVPPVGGADKAPAPPPLVGPGGGADNGPAPRLPPPPQEGGRGGGDTKVEAAATLQEQTYDLDAVDILDVNAKKLDKKAVAKSLKEETLALASLYGRPVDPLHLRLVKDGTLVFVLPAPKGAPPGADVRPGFGRFPPPYVPETQPVPRERVGAEGQGGDAPPPQYQDLAPVPPGAKKP